jgi:DNA primase
MPAWLDKIVVDAHAGLVTSPESVAYLHARGVSVAMMAQYRIGYLSADYFVEMCPKDFALWQARYLRERLVFPLTSPVGAVIGLLTRGIGEKQYTKYALAGLPDGAGSFPTVFGVEQAIEAVYARQQVILVEGPFDLFAVRHYAQHAVAILGGTVTAAGLTFLRRYVRHVFALLDMDEAGRQGVSKLASYGNQHGFMVSAPTYGAHDPADLLQQENGRYHLAQLLTPALMEWPHT